MISVLVPVYNVEAYLCRCLRSILASDHEDFEIVCIDDGSSDGSGQILDAYARLDSRIRVFHQENRGISAARNHALQKARGEYLLFVDSDDYIEPTMLSRLHDEAVRSKADVVQCGFVMDYRFFRLYRPGCGHHGFDTLQALHHLAAQKYLNNYPWGKLIAASCFAGIEFPEAQPGFEDTLTLFKAIARAKRIVTIPDRFYHYVQRRGSLTNRMDLETVERMRRAYDYQRDHLQTLYPAETFDFDLPYYYTDMVILYTLIFFCTRKDQPRFTPAPIRWKRIPWIYRLAYRAWLGVAMARLGRNIYVPASRKKARTSCADEAV